MADYSAGTVKANGISFHYLEMGEGPLVLCMHGFPDHAHTYRHLLPELAGAGFRAVAPFTRGYAPTGAPADGRYQTALLSKDVIALMDALGSETAALVGHDWGARAVQGAAVLMPHRITRLATIGASHSAAGDAMNYHYLKGTWHVYYFQLPVAERAVAHNDFAFIEEWWRDASPEWDIPGDVLEGVKETFRKPGVVKAALDYYRHSVNTAYHDPALEDAQRRVNTAPVTVPTLALHGTRDRPRRLEAFHSMDGYFTGGLEKVVIEGTGHFMHLEKPREVNSRIVEFLLR